MKKVCFFLMATILLICQFGYSNAAKPIAFSYVTPGTINSCMLMVPETDYICEIYTLENCMSCCYPCLYQGGIVEFDADLTHQIELKTIVYFIGPELHLILECVNIIRANFITKWTIKPNGDIIIFDNNYIYYLALL